MTPPTALALDSVSRRFGSTQALNGLDLSIKPGTVHALLGENGAGKSTAIRIMAGLDAPDTGTLSIFGEPAPRLTRDAAIRRGIGLVPQTDSLVGELTLVENLLLSQPEQILRRGAMTTRLRQIADAAGVEVPLQTRVDRLGRGQRQTGELLLALAQGARVLLLDEPTAALGPIETGRLYARLRALAEAGTAIVFVTHRLSEVREVADVATVLAAGHARWQGPVDGVDDTELLSAMVGELPAEPPPRPARAFGPMALTFDGVTAVCGDEAPVRDVTMRIRAGEVVAVLGVAGNGQRALAEVAAGLIQPVSGRVTATPPIAYVPETRLDGLLPRWASKWSAMAARLLDARFVRAGVVAEEAVTAAAAAQLKGDGVRPADPQLPVAALSGGNQQKLLIGRELGQQPGVAVLHSPSQGLDLHAARTVQNRIAAAAAAGTAVLLVSADLEEVRELASRLVVLSAGRIIGEFATADFDEAVYRRLTASRHHSRPDRAQS